MLRETCHFRDSLMLLSFNYGHGTILGQKLLVNSMKKLTPMRAIREKCMDCCCWQRKEVRLCPIVRCSLYPYRFGKRPKNDMPRAP